MSSSEQTSASNGGSGGSIVFWIFVFVGFTAIPMTIDMLRIFLPRRLFSGRLVAAWQRPLLIGMAVCLCIWAYDAFWAVVRFSHEPFSRLWILHALLITWLWVNSVWNYVLCASVDPGYQQPTMSQSSSLPLDVKHEVFERYAPLCKVCDRRVAQFDHHCPFTGGCVGRYNFRFFALFVLHCSVGCGYACVLAWPPFAQCVLSQMTVRSLGMERTPPPDEAKCVAMGAKSMLVVPAAVLFLALSCLGIFHALLLANGITTLQFSRRQRARGGMRSVRDLLLLHGESETDKWGMLWGRAADENATSESASSPPLALAPSRARKARLLLLPSLPSSQGGVAARLAHSESIGSVRSWLGAAAVLACLLLLLPRAVATCESIGGAMRRGFADSMKSHVRAMHGAHRDDYDPGSIKPRVP